MNNDIKNEIEWLFKSYSSRLQKAILMPTPEHWQMASAGYNHLCGFRDGLEAANHKDEADFLNKLLNKYIDK